jgi:hypothetical protein
MSFSSLLNLNMPELDLDNAIAPAKHKHSEPVAAKLPAKLQPVSVRSKHKPKRKAA